MANHVGGLHDRLNRISHRVFTVHDPDGVAVEFVDKLVMGPGGFTQVPATVAHNTANVEKYFPFYNELLGLDFLQRQQPHHGERLPPLAELRGP